MWELCDFEEYLDQALRDQLTMDFQDVQNNIRALLIAETDFSFKRSVEIALRFRNSSAEAKLIAPSEPEIFRMCIRKGRQPIDNLWERGEGPYRRERKYVVSAELKDT
ncbi:LOW QUALITY PROTEIN: hypothetical protein HZS_6872 [Henneguya salminicola]|nr:LOW QUALITY PROTEIN: hypothetical protein HZS_6872 [Henneguya salminicola]